MTQQKMHQIDIKELMEVYRYNFDNFDSYGSNIQWLFAVCDYATDIGVVVPDSFDYRQSPLGSDTDAHCYKELRFFHPTKPQLKKFMLVLERYDRLLRYHNKDY